MYIGCTLLQMMKTYRPPLSDERRKMLHEIARKLNEDALFPVSVHDALNMAIDRAYSSLFPKKHISAKRKRYYRIDF